MKCPFCAIDNDKVIDSRSIEDGYSIRRRRQCLSCDKRFTTFEHVEESHIRVVKRSGSVEAFDKSKVAKGVLWAAKNRPVSVDQVEDLSASVEQAIRLEKIPEVTSQHIGRVVLDFLRDLDEVAYVRFASVYKGFESLSDFHAEMGLLEKQTHNS